MAMADALVAPLVAGLFILMPVKLDLARRSMMVMLARRDRSLGMCELVHAGRSRGHAQCERAEQNCQSRQDFAQIQHQHCFMGGATSRQPHASVRNGWKAAAIT